MEAGDFRHNERSVVVPEAGSLQIRLVPADGGAPVVLRESLPVTAGEVVDATCMSAAALDAFLTAQLAAARAEGILFSIHLKATMMKVSDPLIFGHAVRAALPRTFAAHGAALAAAGLRAEDGLASILAGLDALRTARRSAPPSRPTWRRAPACPWSTPSAASPTCTCPATSLSTPPCPP